MKNKRNKIFHLAVYGIRFKAQVTYMFIFLSLGLLMQTLNMFSCVLYDFQSNDPFTFFLGRMSGFIITMSAAAMLPQVLLSLNCSHLVQTSPLGKKFQTTIFCGLVCVFSLAALTLTLILCLVFSAITPADTTILMQSFLFFGFVAALLIIFWPFTYRYYIVSIIALTSIVTFALLAILWLSDPADGLLIGIPLPVSPAICITIPYIAVIAGSGISLLVTKVLYKKPISKRAFAGMMKREL